MAKLYRASGLGRKTVRVTVELPVSVVAALVASARANRYVDSKASAERIVPELLSRELCCAANLHADYFLYESGEVLRAYSGSCSDDEKGVLFSERLLDVLPEVRSSLVSSSRNTRPWWLKPGRGRNASECEPRYLKR